MKAALRLIVLAAALSWPLAPVAAGEQIVAGLSQNKVQITANFDGSSILIYGAVKRDGPVPPGEPLEVIVTVEGPQAPVTIRKKERVAGVWINRGSVRIEAAPSFYAVATSAPLSRILSETEDLRLSITIPHLIHAIGISSQAEDSADYVEALQRIRANGDRYRTEEGTVQLAEDTLFRADVALPSDLIEGDYNVRMFITRSGSVIDERDLTITVRKAGLERFLYNLAQQQPLLYGVISLAIAALAGWAASAAFRLLRNR